MYFLLTILLAFFSTVIAFIQKIIFNNKRNFIELYFYQSILILIIIKIISFHQIDFLKLIYLKPRYFLY